MVSKSNVNVYFLVTSNYDTCSYAHTLQQIIILFEAWYVVRLPSIDIASGTARSSAYYLDALDNQARATAMMYATG